MKNLVLILVLTLLSATGCQEECTEKQMDMELDGTNENKVRVRHFFNLLEEERMDEFIEMFAENGSQVNPYASGIFPDGAEGKLELKNYWGPVPDNFERMQFEIEELLATEDPNMVFVKYHGKLKLKEGNGFYENDYYSTFKFDQEGKIVEYVEIFNPIPAAQAFGLPINQTKWKAHSYY